MNLILVALFIMLGSAAMADDLPVPPIPPEHPLLTETAPIPNLDARAPVVATTGAPSVGVKFYHPSLPDPGLGFAPGSQYQVNEDRKPLQLPALGISVPLN